MHRFEYAVNIDGHQYPAATANKIKDARTLAAALALKELISDTEKVIHTQLHTEHKVSIGFSGVHIIILCEVIY